MNNVPQHATYQRLAVQRPRVALVPPPIPMIANAVIPLTLVASFCFWFILLVSVLLYLG